MAEGNVAADELRLLIERIERLEEEKKAIGDDVKDVYAEAKARGYDTKTMRAIVRLRKMDEQARNEADALLETYRAALGMDSSFSGTPLGSYGADRKPADTDVHALARKVMDMGGCVVGGKLILPLEGIDGLEGGTLEIAPSKGALFDSVAEAVVNRVASQRVAS